MQGILTDFHWSDVLVVAVLVVLEAALSADNAVALAALVRHLPSDQQRQRALRWGMVGAYGFRIAIVLAATWIVDYPPARFLGALYLLWLTWQHFRSPEDQQAERLPNTANFWQTLVLVELTDLVFSFDSIAASIAVSHKAWVIIVGGILGITLMRYMASFFVRWLDEFSRLEDAAYIIIALVGGRMLLEVVLPSLELPEWAMTPLVILCFVWGFSRRDLPSLDLDLDSETQPDPEELASQHPLS